MALLAATGCGVTSAPVATMSAPRPLIDGQPAVEVDPPAAAPRAIAGIVATYDRVAGVDASAAMIRVHWAAVMPDGLLGETWHDESYGCDTWLVSDAMFSYPKLLPHELAHCARWVLTGDGDAGHTDLAWWSEGGYVDQALVAERSAGL